MHNRDAKWGRRILCCGLLLTLGRKPASGQTAVPEAAITAEIRNMASQAGEIFVGQLVAVRRQKDVVEISFRVEQPVRGVSGTTVVLREWAGNWAPGQMRYPVGLRVLGFLRNSSAAGLSSPVHGAEGLVPVVVQGANAPRLLDIRRVAASVVRAPGTPLPTEASGALPLSDVLRWIAGGSGTSARVALPSHARPPIDLLPVGGPVRNPAEGGLRPVRLPTFSPADGGLADAHR